MAKSSKSFLHQNTISLRAHEIWERDGRPKGKDFDLWWPKAEVELAAAQSSPAEEFQSQNGRTGLAAARS